MFWKLCLRVRLVDEKYDDGDVWETTYCSLGSKIHPVRQYSTAFICQDHMSDSYDCTFAGLCFVFLQDVIFFLWAEVNL